MWRSKSITSSITHPVNRTSFYSWPFEGLDVAFDFLIEAFPIPRTMALAKIVPFAVEQVR